MVKALVGWIHPVGFGYIQQIEGTQNIGFHKSHGVADGAVYMRLSRQMDHPVKGVSGKKLLQQIIVANVTLAKNVIWRVFYIGQIAQVARVGQEIKVHNTVLWVLLDHSFHQMGTDKPGTSGNEDVLSKGHGIIWFQGSKIPGFKLVTERSRSVSWDPGILESYPGCTTVLK
jgi:hypothetical protein